MRQLPAPLRLALAAVAAVAAAATLAPAPALASHPVLLQRFAADSGDACRYGSTEGLLYWVDNHIAAEVAVRISGTVTDRPTTADPGTACRDDRRFTSATFRAFSGNVVVDQRIVRADNGTAAVAFALQGRAGALIERVTITVCRHLLVWAPNGDYCGRTQIYYPSPYTPTDASSPV